MCDGLIYTLYYVCVPILLLFRVSGVVLCRGVLEVLLRWHHSQSAMQQHRRTLQVCNRLMLAAFSLLVATRAVSLCVAKCRVEKTPWVLFTSRGYIALEIGAIISLV